MGFRDLARAVSSAMTDKQRALLKKALEKRTRELKAALVATERALVELSKQSKKGRKRR
jgi:hypothetical protein